MDEVCDDSAILVSNTEISARNKQDGIIIISPTSVE
jgi:hypothetical protein